jgi:uncharacterized phiE125 gp8 family phage protein
MTDGFLTRVAAPAVPIVSTADAKAFLRVDLSEDDSLIDAFVQAATDHMDGESGVLGRALITQTWRYTLPAAPAGDRMFLPLPVVQSVSAVKYYDTDNTEQTLATDQYRLLTGNLSAHIELVRGANWPAVYDRSDAFWIEYVTGYGDAASDVPQAIRTAALLMVGQWYDNRMASAEKVFSELPFGVRALLLNYRVVKGLF